MKILITGGAGYKGILLTEKLLNLGHKVTILDNFMYGYESILHLIKNKNLEILKFDIRNINESIGNWLTIKDYLKSYIIIPDRANIVKKIQQKLNYKQILYLRKQFERIYHLILTQILRL